ncbi:MAG: glycerol-3-phosphate acyltransferase [Dehalococcoidia bacterium]
MINEVIAVVLGYLLGSIPSAYIIGRLMGKIDVRQEGDGRISASAVHKRLGVVPFVLVVIMDVGEGVLAVLVARMLTESLIVVLIAGFAAVVGHNWSVFLKFKGGLGATTIWGVLVCLVWWQFLAVAAVAFILFLIIRKSGLSTAVLIIGLSIVLLVQYLFQNTPLILVIYPLVLILLMVLKRFQVSRTCPR